MLNNLAKKIVKWRKSHGFYTPTSLKSEKSRDMMLGKLMLVVTEISEAAEAVRHNNFMHFVEELSDAQIRILDISGSCKIDLDTTVENKMKINEARPKKHNKFCSL